MIQTWREGLATVDWLIEEANGWTLVPSPLGAGNLHVTLQIVTATSGIVRFESLRMARTRCECCDSAWLAGKLCVGMSTVKLACGSLTSRRSPPHAPSVKPLRIT